MVLLQTIREQCDEPSRSEVARCDVLVSEVIIEVSVRKADHSIQLEEEKFEAGDIWIEKISHSVLFTELKKDFECSLFIFN
jgi:hypothetical protein